MAPNIVVSDKISNSAVNDDVLPPKHAVILQDSASLEQGKTEYLLINFISFYLHFIS